MYLMKNIKKYEHIFICIKKKQMNFIKERTKKQSPLKQLRPSRYWELRQKFDQIVERTKIDIDASPPPRAESKSPKKLPCLEREKQGRYNGYSETVVLKSKQASSDQGDLQSLLRKNLNSFSIHRKPPKTSTTKKNIFSQQLSNEVKYFEEGQLLLGKERKGALWVERRKMVKLIEGEGKAVKGHGEYVLQILGKVKFDGKVYWVMQDTDHQELEIFFQNYGRFTEQLIKKYAMQLCFGLSTIHSLSIPLTLTPNNLFITPFSIMKINLLSKSSSNPYYQSPEYLLWGTLTSKSHSWGVGCAILSMLMGKEIDDSAKDHPYNQEHSDDKIKQIQLKLKIKTNKQQSLQISEELRHFINSCFEIDQNKRPGIQTLQKHHFLSQ